METPYYAIQSLALRAIRSALELEKWSEWVDYFIDEGDLKEEDSKRLEDAILEQVNLI